MLGLLCELPPLPDVDAEEVGILWSWLSSMRWWAQWAVAWCRALLVIDYEGGEVKWVREIMELLEEKCGIPTLEMRGLVARIMSRDSCQNKSTQVHTYKRNKML
jgi:hypothetical protein